MARSSTTFQPGHKSRGGRPRGSPNKATVEIRAVARRLLEDAAYQRNLRRRLIAGRAPQMEVLLHHYAYGKPPERVQHMGDMPFDFGKMLESVWAKLRAAKDPRLVRAMPLPTGETLEILPAGNGQWNGQPGQMRRLEIGIGPHDEEDDDEETWPGDVQPLKLRFAR